MKSLPPIITLDGPSGTGKGTIGLMLARYLNWHWLDSGAIYRVLALQASLKQVASSEVSKLVDLAQQLQLRFDASQEGTTRVFLDDNDVTLAIRTEQCGQDASKVASIPEVRQALLERQRAFAQSPGLVTDGRDMGTIVFPNALLKVYLYASKEERAKRRYLQLKEKGNNVNLAQVVEELEQRDARDTERSHAPLKPADDAVLVDTTDVSIEQAYQYVLHLIEERLKRN